MQISKIIEIIQSEVSTTPYIIAIDGRCGSGKTTLATILKNHFKCNVIHMDDFFLQPHQRTKQRLNEIGGNVDVERFEQEVMIPLKQNRRFTYQKFDCKLQRLNEIVKVEPHDLTIIEGSYCMHPRLYDYYDLHLYLEIDKEKQLERIIRRNGEKNAEIFIQKWIPLEEKYFNEFNIKEISNYHFTIDEINNL